MRYFWKILSCIYKEQTKLPITGMLCRADMICTKAKNVGYQTFAIKKRTGEIVHDIQI